MKAKKRICRTVSVKVSKRKKKCKSPKVVSVKSHVRSGYKVKGYCRS